MLSLDLFSTRAYSKKCNLDIDELYICVKEHQKTHESATVTNRGGYQGPGFYYKPLIDLILDTIPVREDKPEIKGELISWVNVNGKGNYNDIHDHDPYAGTFLSGVFYVKTPANCGRLRLFDPRPFITNAPDMKYYNDSNNYHYFDPKPNLLVLFPGWLKHDVEPNQSDDERISIAFNFRLSNP
jgi:hypothetical protein